MGIFSNLLFISALASSCVVGSKYNNWLDNDEYEMTIEMPQVVSTKPDDLICHSVKLDPTQHQYILEYKPTASRVTAHHMMIYGCEAPASRESSWLCGGAERDELDVCHEKMSRSKRIVYAWALDAPSIQLPEDVGLRVGGDTRIQYMILQLHYKRAFDEGETDSSGVTIRMTNRRQKKQMGFFILGNWGFIPPRRHAFYMESGCQWVRNNTIYPFAYRTHSHNLGRVTSGYRIRDNVWTEIGRMSPQQPETFYSVTNPGTDIKYGDLVAARCTMNSRIRSEDTIIGATNHDEMCNFYFMYSTDAIENLDDVYCFRDAQEFHWNKYLKNIPKTASTLEGVHLLRPDMEPDDLEYMLY